QRGGAVRHHVDAAEELLARRFDRLLQPLEVPGRGIGLVGGRRVPDRVRGGRIVARQSVEENLARALVEPLVALEHLAREREARVLAAFAEERVAQREELLHVAVLRAAPADEPPEEGRGAHRRLTPRRRPWPRPPAARPPRR